MLSITKDTYNFNKIKLDDIVNHNSSKKNKYILYNIKDYSIKNDLNLKYYRKITMNNLKSDNKYLLFMHKPKIALISTNDKFFEHGYNLLNKYNNIPNQSITNKNNFNLENIIKIKLNIKQNINYNNKYDIGIIILGKDQLYSSKTFNFITRCGLSISKYIIYVILSTPINKKNVKKDDNIICNKDIYKYIIDRTNKENINKILVFTYQQKPSNIQKYIVSNIIIQYNNIFHLNNDELEQYALEFKKIYKL
jgi:hypothetical protein